MKKEKNKRMEGQLDEWMMLSMMESWRNLEIELAQGKTASLDFLKFRMVEKNYRLQLLYWEIWSKMEECKLVREPWVLKDFPSFQWFLKFDIPSAHAFAEFLAREFMCIEDAKEHLQFVEVAHLLIDCLQVWKGFNQSAYEGLKQVLSCFPRPRVILPKLKRILTV